MPKSDASSQVKTKRQRVSHRPGSNGELFEPEFLGEHPLKSVEVFGAASSEANAGVEMQILHREVTVASHDLALASKRRTIAPGAVLLSQFIQPREVDLCLIALQTVISKSPFRVMRTPNGSEISVAMTNCGDYGWVSDGRGYRYSRRDPRNGEPWPKIPDALRVLAMRAARCSGYDHFVPDACLINRYEFKSKLSLHQDRNELDLQSPIVSMSLGVPATFLFGGIRREDPCQKIVVHHGDIVVWGGPSRLMFHGIAPLRDGFHPKLGSLRINLSFRRVRRT